MDKENEVYLDCSCGSEVLKIEYDEKLNIYYIAVFHCNGKLSRKNRFRQIWNIIRYGEPYADNLVLKSDDMEIIFNFINKQKEE